MSDFIAAADEVRKLLRGFKAVEVVSAALEKVGSIENAGKEAESLLSTVKAEIAKAQEELTLSKADIMNAKEEAKKLAADAKAKVEARMDKVAADAAKMIADANAGQAEAANRIAAANEELGGIKAECDVVAKELSELESKLAKVKAQAAKMLGV